MSYDYLDLPFFEPGFLQRQIDNLLNFNPGNKEIKDPFSALVEGYSSGDGYAGWLGKENQRAFNKTLTNRLGAFHQEIIGGLPGWESSGRNGEAFDVIHREPFGPRKRPVVGEVKAKYNTMNSSSAANLFQNFQALHKQSAYKGYDKYLIQIIQKRPYHGVWTPNKLGFGEVDSGHRRTGAICVEHRRTWSICRLHDGI
ncbi:Eco47II family restriction endonuclease [Corynebacterium choanae]|uniref:Eco47II restriction endonuclease n=1 Tax=Corynebacterium choanae TaxID=1862358 RepID=A0A3G6J953_9CORY|nr:Eco47II family restriction endonuclease [Corynebacterium choanae]AZA14655.1 Eco47II restriction endonuclease [Corynebacterium choanae]